ncbi:hypothetical protein BK716_16435 [Bacillus thuringiensis serovar higo]|uniref:Uncharacterized protein n=1 Tax=Bacillus thuringiensis subsp. higo TaxID=132266 RepID=A0A9X6QQC2_BACUH|nr:hypothetical protein BK716_16435 [Bacillus thuringiensis serovar higo]
MLPIQWRNFWLLAALDKAKNTKNKKEHIIIFTITKVLLSIVDVGVPLKSHFVTIIDGKKKYRIIFVVIIVRNKVILNQLFTESPAF